MYRYRLICSLLSTAMVLAACGPAHAQWGVPYPNSWGPVQNYNAFGPGATLWGQAQVIQANGQLAIQQEQARQQRQQANQDKLQTRKMAFDLAAYERANTPTFTEEQEKNLSQRIRRVMNEASNAEIKRGDTLNLLMPYIRSLNDRGISGPPTPINPAMLQSVNVRVGSGPSVGMLRDMGRLSWPLMLRGPTQQKLDKLITEAIAQTAAGTLQASTYNSIVNMVQQLQEESSKKFRNDQISSSTFLANKGFLESLESSLRVLQQPDAAQFFDGTFSARGNCVPELVDNMTSSGLRFAPASPGNDAPYFSLHNAFVSYARAAQSGPGFQSQMSPPSLEFKKGVQ
jgi:hypothetical protein